METPETKPTDECCENRDNEKLDTENRPEDAEAEYETSPDAPYNRKSRRHLGNQVNENSTEEEREIARTKQYYHAE
jgi:hypothetical protein